MPLIINEGQCRLVGRLVGVGVGAVDGIPVGEGVGAVEYVGANVGATTGAGVPYAVFNEESKSR
jgi:hypothetical protein